MTATLEGDFNPQFHFLGLIKKAIGDGIPRRCSVAGGPRIVIAPKQMTYYSGCGDIVELLPLCQAQPFDLQIEPLPDWAPGVGKETIQVGRMFMRTQTDSVTGGMNPHPLAGLLWYASLCVSNGRLLQGNRADELVRLKQTPDFTWLHHQESHLKLAQFMLESSADLRTVARQTGVPLAQVFDFFNACAMLGLVERGNILEPEAYFLGIIQKALREGKILRCGLPNLPPLYLAPKERRYYSQLDINGLSPFFGAILESVQVDEVGEIDRGSDEEEETIQIGRMLVRRKKESHAPKLGSGPLDELLWHATMKVSRGRLLAGRRINDVVRLRRWPDFARLSKDRNFLPLAAFMSVNAADLTIVAKRTGASLTQVIDFHNACAVLDFLEYLPEERLSKRPVNDKDKATYRNISKTLGGIRAVRHAG